jgi:thiol:disulfide interchange protein DsbD
VLLGVYSLGFALPYILLGGAAAKISSVKLSPKLQVTTKVIFSSVIFALGLFYLRIPFYEFLSTAKPDYNTIASSLITLGLIMVFVLLVSKRMFSQKFYLIGPSIALGVGIFAFSQSSSISQANKIQWIKSESKALELAAKENRPVLIDAWAEWCVACKKMDVTTFVDPRVINAIREGKIIALKLDLTESNDANDAIQQKYKIQGLPTLIILQKGGSLETMTSLTGLQTASALIPVLESLK